MASYEVPSTIHQSLSAGMLLYALNTLFQCVQRHRRLFSPAEWRSVRLDIMLLADNEVNIENKILTASRLTRQGLPHVHVSDQPESCSPLKHSSHPSCIVIRAHVNRTSKPLSPGSKRSRPSRTAFLAFSLATRAGVQLFAVKTKLSMHHRVRRQCSLWGIPYCSNMLPSSITHHGCD